jgi:mycoredoxin
MQSNDIMIYGADWCEDTQETREHLDQLGVQYQYINVEQDEGAADWVRRQNDGKQKTPTVKLPDLVLSVPSNAQLDAALQTRGLMPRGD